MCSRCVDYYHSEVVMQQLILPEVGPYFSVKSADDFIILPTPLRLDADARFTGKGVTICFIDSGFYQHPDLTMHSNRIKKIIDITKEKQPKNYFTVPHNESWRGTMTSVACAGDGFLSNGLYKGIASDAELVLLKVMSERTPSENDAFTIFSVVIFPASFSEGVSKGVLRDLSDITFNKTNSASEAIPLYNPLLKKPSPAHATDVIVPCQLSLCGTVK